MTWIKRRCLLSWFGLELQRTKRKQNREIECNMALVPLRYGHPLIDPLEIVPYEDPSYLYGLPPPCPQRCHELEINFYSCGRRYRFERWVGPRILHISCANMRPPPSQMCSRYNGLDRELSDWLFKHREYRVKCERALDRVAEAINNWQPSSDGPRFCAVVRCKIGVHRSVAMAEMLAKEVSTWGGIRVTVTYVLFQPFALF